MIIKILEIISDVSLAQRRSTISHISRSCSVCAGWSVSVVARHLRHNIHVLLLVLCLTTVWPLSTVTSLATYLVCLSFVRNPSLASFFNPDNIIGPNGLLSTKARILVTNSIAFISQFDHLAFIRRGIVLEQGSYLSLLANPNSEIAKLV